MSQAEPYPFRATGKLAEVGQMYEGRFEKWEPAPALTSLESGDVRYEFMTWIGSGVLGPKLKESSPGKKEKSSTPPEIKFAFGSVERVSFLGHGEGNHARSS